MFERLKQRLRRGGDQGGDELPASDEQLTTPEKPAPQPGTAATSAPTGVLSINGKSYDLNALPDDVQTLLRAVQQADELIRLKRDCIRMLGMGRTQMGQDLQRRLEHCTPLEEGSAEEPSWRAVVSSD